MSKIKIINDLENTLEKMYPHFIHKVEYSTVAKNYLITVFRNGHKLKTLVLLPDTPMDTTMDLIKEWMSNLIKGLR